MERGTPKRPRTFELPGSGAGVNQILEFQEANSEAIVSAMVSFAQEIAWTFAKDRNQAIDFFDNARDDGHYEYFIYRTGDNQYEIPCRGMPGNLYIRASSAIPNTARGLSIAFIVGGERP